ncbi:MAG: sugar lactone lactonase YvrE [Akkermansiaceae bacterium]|jgi:sugar lactone lactonase YvrE
MTYSSRSTTVASDEEAGFSSGFRRVFRYVGRRLTLVASFFAAHGTVQAADRLVTTLEDQNDVPAGAVISLREAIRDASAGDKVIFEPTLFSAPGAIVELQSELVVDKAVMVDGGSLADGVPVSGGGITRLFRVTASGDLTLRGLTLSGGNGASSVQSGQGGAILNDGTLTVSGCTLTGNTATAGGAIYNKGNLVRTLSITDSTLSDNTATAGFGGAIFNDGTLTVTQSTLAGNSVTDPNSGGGAIYNLKSLTLTQTTVSGNHAPIGGALCLFDGSRTSTVNTIIAGNGSIQGGHDSDFGFNGNPPPAFNIEVVGPTLVGTNSGVASLFPAGSLVGTPTAILDPQLYPLGDYGGPTETMALREGGPGVNAGGSTTLVTDQRGFERVLAGVVDLGSYEIPGVDFGPDGFTLHGAVPSNAAGPGDTVRFQISPDPEFLATVGTLAGKADVADLADGPRLAARFNNPTGVAQDSLGNFFIADTGNHRIRMITPGGEVLTIAGSGTGPFRFGFVDGPGSSAQFAFPVGLAVGPNDDLYVADTFNHSIRKVTRPSVPGQSWTVTTLAGDGVAGLINGSGNSARFNSPHGLAIAADGQIYVGDTENFVIRRIAADGSAVTTYAGSGSPFLSGCSTNGTATVTCSTTSTLAIGEAISGANIPAGANVAGIISATTFELSTATTGTGTDLQLVRFANGERLQATFNSPHGLTFNNMGTKLYVADSGSHRIREITLDQAGSTGTVDTFAGTGEIGFADGSPGTATFHTPASISFDADNTLFVADEFNHAVRRISTGGLVSTVAGLGAGNAGELDGRADVATFDCPVGLAVDRVNLVDTLVVSDTLNQLLRRVVVKSLEVEVILGQADPVTGLTPISTVLDAGLLGLNPDTIYYTRWTTTAPIIPNVQPSGQRIYFFEPPTTETLAQTEVVAVGALLNIQFNPNGSSTRIEFEFANNAAMNSSERVLVAPAAYGLTGEADQTLNVAIPQPATAGETVFYRAVTTNARGTTLGDILSFTFPTTEVVTGSPDQETRTSARVTGTINAEGSATSAMFEYSTRSDLSNPWQVATQAGDGQAGLFDSTDPEIVRFNAPEGIAVFGGFTYVADRLNHLIRKVSATGEVSTFAGSTVGFNDGSPTLAKLDHPSGLVADGIGNLYLADEHNHRIRKINLATGVVSTIAGSSTAGYLDAVGGAAQFLFPRGLTIDAAGNLYVADTGNHSIRKISLPDNTVTTVAGTGAVGFIDGERGLGQLSSPRAVVAGAAGELYVADTGNHAVRRIASAGELTTLAGTGTAGFLDGPGQSALFSTPTGLTLLQDVLYLTDRDNHRVRVVELDGETSTLAGSGAAGKIDSPSDKLHPATVSEFSSPIGIAAVSPGTLWVTEIGNHDLRKVAQITLPTIELAGDITGATAQPVEAQISGLLAGTTYYFRAVGSNAIGPIAGEIVSLTTRTNQRLAVYDGPSSSSPLLAGGGTDLGTTPRGIAVTRTFTVANLGQWPLAITSITVPEGFGVAYDPNPVAPGAERLVEVTLTAAEGATPAGDLVINTDDPEQASFNVAINGVVLDPPVVVTLPVALDADPALRAEIDPKGSDTTVTFAYSTDPELDGFEVLTLAGSQAGYAEGVVNTARFDQLNGIALDTAGNIFVADTRNHCIRKINPSGVTSVFAGSPGNSGFSDGASEVARFNEPIGLVMNADGNLFVADSRNHRIRMILPTGEVSTYAGFTEAGFTDGVGTAARFQTPSGLAIGAGGELYLADRLNHRVRIIGTDRRVRTLTGSGAGGTLNEPVALAVTQTGTVYLTEAGRSAILTIDPTGVVTTLAGGPSGFADGLGGAARFASPIGLLLDSNGSLFVADTGNNRIRQMALSSGEVTTFAGNGSAVGNDGDSAVAGIVLPLSLAINPEGDLFIGEGGNSRVRGVSSTTQFLTVEDLVAADSALTEVSQAVTGLLEDTDYYYRASAENGGGASLGEIISFKKQTTSPFLAWQQSNFASDAGDPAIAGAGADPSGDGVPNLLKYAFGLDPKVSSPDGVPIVEVSGGQAALVYTRVLSAGDLDYLAEWSSDLIEWKATDFTETILSSVGDTERVAATLTTTAFSQRFLRIRVVIR